VPDLSHLWQRFVLAVALLFGLALGVAATVFGYSNTAPVTLGFSVFHISTVPLWTVALVPLALVLVTGTVFHWLNGLHHFTEHMRHRRRVHELEAEVTSLKAHLDQLLEMPSHAETKPAETVSPEPAATNGSDASAKKPRKRISLPSASETETVAVPTDGAAETEPRAESNPET
jgi:uncharacterized integral membrane protein